MTPRKQAKMLKLLHRIRAELAEARQARLSGNKRQWQQQMDTIDVMMEVYKMHRRS